jgi:hypothetical protein
VACCYAHNNWGKGWSLLQLFEEKTNVLLILLWEFELFLHCSIIDYLGSNKSLCTDSDVLLAQKEDHF